MEVCCRWTYDKIELVYNRFKNAATQIIMSEQFLPIVPVEGDTNANLIIFLSHLKKKLLRINSKVFKDTII